MKRQDDLSVGGSIFMTVVFAAAAIFTYQTDPSGNTLAWIPCSGVIIGIIMTIIAANKASNESAKRFNKRVLERLSLMIVVSEMAI